MIDPSSELPFCGIGTFFLRLILHSQNTPFILPLPLSNSWVLSTKIAGYSGGSMPAIKLRIDMETYGTTISPNAAYPYCYSWYPIVR